MNQEFNENLNWLSKSFHENLNTIVLKIYHDLNDNLHTQPFEELDRDLDLVLEIIIEN